MKVGDLAIVLPYEVKLRARWNNETRSEDYIGQCGTVTEIMEELCGQPLAPPLVYVEFGDGYLGSYSPDKLEKYNPLSIDEDYYITPRKDKQEATRTMHGGPESVMGERGQKDLDYMVLGDLLSKEYLMESEE